MNAATNTHCSCSGAETGADHADWCDAAWPAPESEEKTKVHVYSPEFIAQYMTMNRNCVFLMLDGGRVLFRVSDMEVLTEVANMLPLLSRGTKIELVTASGESYTWEGKA